MIPYFAVGVLSVGISGFAMLVRRSRAVRDERLVTGRMPFWALVLVSGVLVVFSGLRFQVGSDFSMYSNFFHRVDPTSLEKSLQLVPQEPGFVLLMMLVRGFSDNPSALFLTAAALTVVPVMLSIRRLTDRPTLALFYYFFLAYYAISLNSVRQSIAVSFLLMGEAYRKDSKVVWLVCSAIAYTFHSSALIAFFVLLFSRRWRPGLWSSILLLVGGAIAALWVLRVDIVRDWLVSLNSRYDGYFEEEGAGVGTMLIIAIRIVLVLYALYVARDRTDAEYSRYLTITLISVLVLMLGLSSWVFARLEPYFGIFLIFLIPEVLRGRRNERALSVLFVIATMLYFGIHITFFNNLVPYQAVRFG